MSSWFSRVLGTNTPAGQTPAELAQKAIQDQQNAYNTAKSELQTAKDAAANQIQQAFSAREAQIGKQYTTDKQNELLRRNVDPDSPLYKSAMATAEDSANRAYDSAASTKAGMMANNTSNFANAMSQIYTSGYPSSALSYYQALQQSTPSLWQTIGNIGKTASEIYANLK